MSKYTVEVEAETLSASGMNAEALAQWSGCGTAQQVASHAGGLTMCVLLLTPRGQLTVMDGDTVVRMGHVFAVFPAQTFENYITTPAATEPIKAVNAEIDAVLTEQRETEAEAVEREAAEAQKNT